MSSERGNCKRTRSQKYQNKTAFKNNLHDTSKRGKEINSLEIREVCKQCKEKIEWKIKYKKYKPLSQPKTCLKCHSKAIKFAYHVLCEPCGKSLGVCCKCQMSKKLVQSNSSIKSREDILAEMDGELKLLPERKRRAFYRYLDNLYQPKKNRNVPEAEEKLNERVTLETEVENEDDDLNPDYFELVRRRLDLLGRQVLENSFGDEDFEDENFDSY